MVSLDKYSGGCNYSNDLSSKIRVSSKRKDINLKIFNMMTNINEVKTFVKHFSCDCKSKFYCTAWNLNQKCNNQTGQCDCKIYGTCKKNYSWNPCTRTCENSKYLKSDFHESVIECDEYICVMNIASTKMTNNCAIATNVSKNFHNIKLRHKIDCYILDTVFLAIILLLTIIIVCYRYKNHISKSKNILRRWQYKMKSNDFKKYKIEVIISVIILLT